MLKRRLTDQGGKIKETHGNRRRGFKCRSRPLLGRSEFFFFFFFFDDANCFCGHAFVLRFYLA